jgi:prepilin-type N-terminal cleavage/methylation domain-containing protein
MMRTKPVGQSVLSRRQDGFTFVELIIVLVILGILAAISISNVRSYRAKAEYAAMRTTLKHLMDGEDFSLFKNSTFYPSSGTVNIPKETAMDIPELAYNFPEGHKNRYTIRGTNNSRRNYYRITVRCDFDADNNGRNDRYVVTTNIRRGEVRRNREFSQLQ